MTHYFAKLRGACCSDKYPLDEIDVVGVACYLCISAALLRPPALRTEFLSSPYEAKYWPRLDILFSSTSWMMVVLLLKISGTPVDVKLGIVLVSNAVCCALFCSAIRSSFCRTSSSCFLFSASII